MVQVAAVHAGFLCLVSVTVNVTVKFCQCHCQCQCHCLAYSRQLRTGAHCRRADGGPISTAPAMPGPYLQVNHHHGSSGPVATVVVVGLGSESRCGTLSSDYLCVGFTWKCYESKAKQSNPSTAPENLWCPPHRSCHLPWGKAECMHASTACLLLKTMCGFHLEMR